MTTPAAPEGPTAATWTERPGLMTKATVVMRDNGQGDDRSGLPLPAVAIREAYEECGLQVQVSGFLADSTRTLSQ